jgi:hypothetical protein
MYLLKKAKSVIYHTIILLTCILVCPAINAATICNAGDTIYDIHPSCPSINDQITCERSVVMIPPRPPVGNAAVVCTWKNHCYVSSKIVSCSIKK